MSDVNSQTVQDAGATEHGHTCRGDCGSHAQPEETGEFPSGSTNPCKLCTPLGACLVFKGVEGCIPLLHGSQGCATYIRRYCISHYREPLDIASSNFSEDTAIFGGRKNLHIAIDNVILQYRPKVIGIATTCLSETMGENIPMMLAEYRNERRDLPSAEELPVLVPVSTPSYKHTHAEGFHATVRALVDIATKESLPLPVQQISPLALFPGMVSPEDIRHLKDICELWQLPVTILPDYSDTLDGVSWSDYERVPEGGTRIEDVGAMKRAPAAIEFGRVLAKEAKTAGTCLVERFNTPLHRLGLPVGLRECDRFFDALELITGRPLPIRYQKERGRLIDSYVDGHKYAAGKKAVIYGEDDLVVALASFVAEIGMVPVLCAGGSRTGKLKTALLGAAPELEGKIEIREGADFSDIEARAEELAPDLLIGSSKGRKLARARGIPLVTCGFPIHDRIGAQRMKILGYSGTQELFDRIINGLLEAKQENSKIGYSYL